MYQTIQQVFQALLEGRIGLGNWLPGPIPPIPTYLLTLVYALPVLLYNLPTDLCLWNIPGGTALSETIASCVHYVTLQKYFSHPSLVINFFPTLPSKLVHWDCK